MSDRKPGLDRRKFLAVAGAATAAGCANPAPDKAAQGPTPKNPGDPHSAVTLPGRESVYNPGAWGPATRQDWSNKNIFVLMLDSFRADHLGAMAPAVATKVPGLTPNLDAFASDATLFTRSYPEGLPTLPVRTSLFSGYFTYPFRDWQVLYPQDHPLLAEILWSEGFRTALISDTYHMHKPSYGFGRGFDDVIWIRGQESDPLVRDPAINVDISNHFKLRGESDPANRNQTQQYMNNRHDWQQESDWFTAQVFEEATAWVERQRKKENLFLWIDCFSPHEAWDPPDEFLKRVAPDYSGQKLVLPSPGDVAGYLDEAEMANVAALYAGAVAHVDARVGYFLDELKRMDLYDDSLIVIATDHGEPFGDHGIVRKIRPWAYEELSRTFLMIREPGGPKVKQVDSYTQQTDLTATLLDHATVAVPDWMHSRSLLPLLRGDEEKVRDFAVCCHHHKSVSIRQDDWSYHYWLDGPAKQVKNSQLTKDAPELYNIADDPTEHNDLAAAEPDRAEAMDETMRAFTQELIADAPA